MKIGQIIVLIISLLFAVFCVTPILAHFVDLPLGFINIITFAVILAVCPNAFFNRATLWTVIYLGYLLLCHYCGKKLPFLGIADYDNMRLIIIESAYILPNIAIANALLYYNNKKLYNWFVYIILFAIIVQFIYLTPILLVYKNALRSVVENNNVTSPIIGLPTYSLTHAYIIILAPLLYGVKVISGKLRVLFIVFLLYLLFVLYSSSVAANVFIALILIVISILIKEKNNSKIVARGIIVLFIGFLLYVSGILQACFDQLITWSEGSGLESKLTPIRDLLVNGKMSSGSTFEERDYLHQISIDAFFTNPLTGSLPIGEHSSILDRLGGLGLLGFIPYAMIFYSMIERWFKTINIKYTRMFFALGLFSVVLLLYQKGLFGQECWLFCIVLLPALLITIDGLLNKEKELKRQDKKLFAPSKINLTK